jgi:DNA-binding transcriptional regulator YiaG
MNCPQCARPMGSTSDDHLYAECGLVTVMLGDVVVHDCSVCGEKLVALPHVEGLHRAIAMGVVQKRARLTPREVRFLRKYLGWSAPEFARYFGESAETVAAWEDVAAPRPMGEVAERLLRLMVSTTSAGDRLRLADLLELGVEEREPTWLRMELGDAGWRRQPD